MIKKQEICYADGKYTLFKVLGIPILQYVKNNNQKIQIKIPFLKKQNEQGLMFYLKYNSNSFHSIWCLHKWIETINHMGGHYVIICDNPQLEDRIIKNTIFGDSYYKFIKSDRKTLKNVIGNICDKSWINAGFSHLTTFTHSKKIGIEEFWNIDVDDTTLFDTPENIAKSLKKVMEYSKENDIDVFSLDMHATRFNNKHWSFGVTYTRNNSKILNIIKGTKNKNWQELFVNLQKIFGDFNLDWYFTYLRDRQILKAKTFNINNLYFAHWGFSTPTALTRVIQVEINRKLCFPLAKALCHEDFMQAIPLKEDIVTFETGIDKEKSLEILSNMLSSYESVIKNTTENECALNNN